MCKGVIVLVQAESTEAARKSVDDFLEGYDGEVFDWWNFGGRWFDVLGTDVAPLALCLPTVMDWAQDPEQAGKAMEAQARTWIEAGPKRSLYMYGHVLGRAALLFQSRLCVDCSVFNAETLDYTVPEDPAGWFAVMVDGHF